MYLFSKPCPAVLVAAMVAVGSLAYAGPSASAALLTGYEPGTHGTFFQIPLEQDTELDGETFSIASDSLAASVDVYVSRRFNPLTTADLTLSLYDTADSINGPQPNNLLAQVSNPASSVSSSFITYVLFTFATPVPLTGGASYALVLTSTQTDGAYTWYADQTPPLSSPPYSNGNWISQGSPSLPWAQQPTSALGFHVYSVPEPSSLALLGLSAGALFGRRRK